MTERFRLEGEVAAAATSRQALEAARAEIVAGLGEPTVLVNAAGGNDPRVTVTDELAFEDTGHVPLSRVVAYSAAKAGVLSLTRFLARQWAPHVRVNSITPGFFPGEQNRRLLFGDDGQPTERGRQILGHTPVARFGDPDELVGAAVFLASSRAAGFVTGADLRVDGGFLATTI